KQHQAMFEAPIPGTKAGDIVQIMGVGFNIGDRLLRPAQVGVSSGAPAMPRPPESGAESASE
ncbi:MAG: nucleotide exchange factor GrpE, partial [Rhodobacteraceae bacterium]|nr:nucleotide exchange factor GrpE [Paracoccaceae bacterium]